MKNLMSVITVFTVGLSIGLLICSLLLKKYGLKVKKKEKEVTVLVGGRLNTNQYIIEILNLKNKVNNLIKCDLDYKSLEDSILHINCNIGTAFLTPKLNLMKYSSGYYEVICFSESAFIQNYYLQNYYLFTPDTLYEVYLKPLRIIVDTLQIIDNK